MTGTSKERFWNVPNVLTLIRFALVPLLALMILRQRAVGALVVVFVAGSTDVLDGLAARALGQRTRIGRILDPLADKFLLSTAFILLTLRSLGLSATIPLWLTAAVIGRDFLILAGGVSIYRIRGPREFPPSVAGKICSVFQVATVFWVILANTVQASSLGRSSLLAAVTSPTVLESLFIATLLLTLASGIQYVLKGVRMMFPPAA